MADIPGRRNPATLGAAAALAIVLAAGLVRGVVTDRWGGDRREVEEAVTRLERVPMIVGDWVGQAGEMDRRALEIGEIDGYLCRRYERRRDAEAVSVLVVCGRPGPIAVHTPDICYLGAGYELASGPVAEAVATGPGSAAATFRVATFRKTVAAVPTSLRVAWSWNAGPAWEAPGEPRLRFAADPVLYKVYLVRELRAGDPARDADVVHGFARDFLPVLDRVLFPPSAT